MPYEATDIMPRGEKAAAGAIELARKRLVSCLLSILALLALAFTQTAQAQPMLDESSKTAGGLLVYVGFLPAEMLKTHAPAHAEEQMHGGVPKGRHEYHLVVAVFDEKSGDRVSDAEVFAKISPLGLSGSRKRLEPMEIAGTTTYGEFFDLPSADMYTVALEIKGAGTRSRVKFDFTFHHYPPIDDEQP